MLPLLIKVHGIAKYTLNKLLSSGGIKENCFLLHRTFSWNVKKIYSSNFFTDKKDSGWLFLINSLHILYISLVLAIYFGEPERVLVDVGSYQ